MGTVESLAWLENFYARFGEETRLLHEIEPFWRPCQKCPDGFCCSRLIYSVQNGGEGNPFIIEDWTRMLKYVQLAFTQANKTRLIRSILSNSNNCIFLVDGRCSIYPARPWSCRTHPYTVSFYPNPVLFPLSEIALPSCPALAGSFGIKKDQLWLQPLPAASRDPRRNLVKIKLKKNKPIWLIDASDYIQEYEKNAPSADRPDSEWLELFSLAKQAGGVQGDILAAYVETITERKP